MRSRLLAPLAAALLGAVALGALTPIPALASTTASAGRALPGDAGDGGTQVRPRRGKQGPSAIFPRSSYLCYGYKNCRSAGMGNAGYAANNGTMYWRMYSGHNCTNYAAYRMVHSGLPNVRPWSGSGNAMYWGTSMPKITDGTPRIGAVAWWKANTGPAGSVGHVAYVERVVSPDEVVVSQDSWGGDFSWAVITRSSGNWPSGFIHFNDLKLRNTARPVISGVAKVGSVLSSTRGGWTPGTPTVTYQWNADGQPIANAVGSTLKLGKALVGRQITVTTTATTAGYNPVKATSDPTAAVLPGQLRNVTPPQIAGEPKVDSSLSLTTGTWTPSASLHVQWLADGEPLSGAMGLTLALTPDLVDKVISARVTATKSGYDPVTATSAPTAPVAPGTITAATAPSITGTLALGETLTVDPGVYQPADGEVAVQWLRRGKEIPGATDPTYQLTADDLGARIAARITVSRAGYVTASFDAPSTTVLRSTPRLRVHRQRGPHQLLVTVTLKAPGVSEVTGPVVVRIGRMRQQATLSGGTATLTLVDPPTGERSMRVRYLGSGTVKGAQLVRTIWVR